MMSLHDFIASSLLLLAVAAGICVLSGLVMALRVLTTARRRRERHVREHWLCEHEQEPKRKAGEQ